MYLLHGVLRPVLGAAERLPKAVVASLDISTTDDLLVTCQGRFCAEVLIAAGTFSRPVWGYLGQVLIVQSEERAKGSVRTQPGWQRRPTAAVIVGSIGHGTTPRWRSLGSYVKLSS